MTEYFDALETRDAGAARGATLLARAAGAGGACADARRRPSREILDGVDAARRHDRARRSRGCRSRASTNCSSGRRPQRASDPFGGFAAHRASGRACRASSRRPGPIYEPEGDARDYWRIGARAVRRGLSRRRPGAQLLQLPLHAGRLDDGNAARTRSAARCSRPAPARPSSRCRRSPTCGPTAYVGTPSFLRILLEKAAETGIDICHR